MAFTTWAALKVSVLDAIAGHVEGTPFLFKYELDGVSREYRSIEELERLYNFACRQESKTTRKRRSFGRHRRFQ